MKPHRYHGIAAVLRNPSSRPCYHRRMTPHDQQRFAAMINDFVEDCGFERPFHLVTIDSRGTVSVTRYGPHGVEQVCSGPAKANRLRMMPPLVVTVISSDGARQGGADHGRGGNGDDAVASALSLATIVTDSTSPRGCDHAGH